MFLGEFDAWSDINSIIPKPTGMMDHLNLSGSIFTSTETVYSDAGCSGSSFENSLHYVHWQTTPVSESPNSACTSKPPPGPPLCPECSKQFGRQQDLQRHIISFHLPCYLHCPYSSCLWRGHRKEEFKAHLRVHPGSDPIDPSHIYDVKMVVDWIKEGTPVETAAGYALGLVSERAYELGFVEEWKDLWG